MSAHGGSPAVDTAKGDATATHSQVHPSRISDIGAGDPGVVSRSASNSSADKRSEFRKRVGITETGETTPNIANPLRGKKDPEHFLTKRRTPDKYLFRYRIEKAYRDQTRYYYFVASASHGMLWLQIAIGASVTALGTTNSNAARIAITILGAINTVLAGFLTFLKSRNQPNRALQFRNSLRGVYEDLWQFDAEMVSGHGDINADDKVDALWTKYKEARAESEANYPDLWVTLGKVTKSRDPENHPATQLDETHVPADNGSEHQAPEASEPLLPKKSP